MKKLLLLFVMAIAAFAQITPYPNVDTPTDVVVLVYQATYAACQIVEAYQLPCGQHVTVMMFPHNPETITYKVTMTYMMYPNTGVNGVGTPEYVWSKQALDIDHQGMVSVTFLIGSIQITNVKVEKITTSTPQPAVTPATREREKRY